MLAIVEPMGQKEGKKMKEKGRGIRPRHIDGQQIGGNERIGPNDGEHGPGNWPFGDAMGMGWMDGKWGHHCLWAVELLFLAFVPAFNPLADEKGGERRRRAR